MFADANGLVEAMKRAARGEREASKPVELCFGKVIAKSPLKINVEQKMELGELQLVLSRNVTDYTATATVQWETESDKIRHRHAAADGDTEYAEAPHAHGIAGQKKIIIHNALEVGDEVILIRQQGGQKYVVIDRIGGR